MEHAPAKDQPEKAIHAGLGITIDSDNEVAILVVMGTEDGKSYAAPFSPEIARHFARRMRDYSREADQLQDELGDLDPEEIPDRLQAIQQRLNGTS